MRTSWSLASCAVLGMLILQTAAEAAVTYSFGPEADLLDAAFYAGQPEDGSDVAGRMASEGQASNDGKRVVFFGVNSATYQLAFFIVDLGYPSSWRRLTPDFNATPITPIHWTADNLNVIAGPVRLNVEMGAITELKPMGYSLHDANMTRLPDNNWLVSRQYHGAGNGSDILVVPVLPNGDEDPSREGARVTDFSPAIYVDGFDIVPDGTSLTFQKYDEVHPGQGPDSGSIYVLKNLPAILAAAKKPDALTSELAPTNLDDPNIVHIRADETPKGNPACNPYYPADHTKILYFEDWNSKFEVEDFYNTLAQADFDIMISNADGSGDDFRIARPGNQAWATTTPDGTRLLYVNMTGPTTSHLMITTLVTSTDVVGDVVGDPADNTIVLTSPQQASDLGANVLAAPPGTEVTFPPGALQRIDMNTPIAPTMKPELPPAVDAIPLITKFQPEGTTFATPVSVTVPYTHDEIAGMDEANLRVFLYNAATGKYDIEVTTITARDVVNNTITFTIDHFSKYGIAAQSITNQPYRELFDDQWNDLNTLLHLGLEPVDADHDGLPEQWALRLVAVVLGDIRYPYHNAVADAYAQNLVALAAEAPSVQPYKDVLAALLLMSVDLRQYFTSSLGLTGSYTVVTGNGKSPNEPLSGAGDIDRDGITNADEYAAVLTAGGSMEDFVQSALYWQGAGALPVAGLAGLGALLGLITITGIRTMRKK